MPASYRQRAAKSIAPDKKRRRELEWQDTRKPAWMAWLSLVCVFVLFLAALAFSRTDITSKPQAINGDQLGAFGRSETDYRTDSDRALDAASGDQPRWALITPQNSWTPRAAAQLFDGKDVRLSTVYFGPSVQLPLPEPVAGKNREDVLDQAAATIARSADISPDDPALTINGLLVRATPHTLRQVREDKSVLAVEPTDPGAVYGRIGIQPKVSMG